MKRVLIDTNIALDILQNREPFAIDALEIFAYAENGHIELFLSTDSVSTIFYLVSKASGRTVALEAVSKLLDFVKLGVLDEEAVLRGLALNFKDVEDAFIASVAEKIKAEAIITRDKKDFTASPVQALSPKEFLAALKAKKSL